MPVISEKKGNAMTAQEASPLLALQLLTLGYQVRGNCQKAWLVPGSDLRIPQIAW
jgi:hypothetical protein